VLPCPAARVEDEPGVARDAVQVIGGVILQQDHQVRTRDLGVQVDRLPDRLVGPVLVRAAVIKTSTATSSFFCGWKCQIKEALPSISNCSPGGSRQTMTQTTAARLAPLR